MTFRAQGRKVFRRTSCSDVAEQSFERVIVRLGDGKRFAGRWCIGAANIPLRPPKLCPVAGRPAYAGAGILRRCHQAKISRATITTSMTCNSRPRIEAKPAMPPKSPCPNSRPNRPAPRKPTQSRRTIRRRTSQDALQSGRWARRCRVVSSKAGKGRGDTFHRAGGRSRPPLSAQGDGSAHVLGCGHLADRPMQRVRAQPRATRRSAGWLSAR